MSSDNYRCPSGTLSRIPQRHSNPIGPAFFAVQSEETSAPRQGSGIALTSLAFQLCPAAVQSLRNAVYDLDAGLPGGAQLREGFARVLEGKGVLDEHLRRQRLRRTISRRAEYRCAGMPCVPRSSSSSATPRSRGRSAWRSSPTINPTCTCRPRVRRAGDGVEARL